MIALVAGTRPNFMKIAPITRELTRRGVPFRLIHTGQHFDASMSEVFFRDLGMPEPHVRLTAGGGTQGEQTAAIIVGVERELMNNRPELVVVVGDVTSTMAAALAASKLQIPVIHVEAGLRSHDWTMPEEINRLVTDRLSDLLLTPSTDAEPNLLAEGIEPRRIRFVGNVMIDSLRYASERPTEVLSRLGVSEGQYILVTLHRPANVDTLEQLSRTLDVLKELSRRLPVVFPVHPRTVSRLSGLGLSGQLESLAKVKTFEPLGYNDFVTLMSRARIVATDSGGLQEETTALGIPCLTLRAGTERPITVTVGTNVIVGLDPVRAAEETDRILAGYGKRGGIPEGWDGRAGERIVDALVAFTHGDPPPLTAGPRA